MATVGDSNSRVMAFYGVLWQYCVYNNWRVHVTLFFRLILIDK